jgi:hypothetical protein
LVLAEHLAVMALIRFSQLSPLLAAVAVRRLGAMVFLVDLVVALVKVELVERQQQIKDTLVATQGH